MKLEDELGAKLFTRKGGQVGLTLYGEVFHPKIECILQQLQQAQTQILEMAKVEKGKVTLGVIPTVTPFLLPDILAGFFKQHPLVEVNVKEETSELLLRALQQKTIDIAIMPIPVDPAEFSSIELMRERLFAIVGENHPLRHEKEISLQQLSGAPFLILKDGHCFRDDTLSVFHGANVEPRVVFETGCFLTILNMVRAGIGISVMPEMAVEATLGCKFIPIKAERPVRTIGLVQSKERYQSHVQRLLGSYLKAQIRTAEITEPGKPLEKKN